MDVGGVVILVLAALGLFWISRPLWRRLPLRASAATPESAVEEARAAGLKVDWDELGVDQLEANRTFQRHVERLSRSDVPFQEVAQLAQSGSPGIAALGLSAIVRRDDVPEKWISDAIRSKKAVRTVEPTACTRSSSSPSHRPHRGRTPSRRSSVRGRSSAGRRARTASCGATASSPRRSSATRCAVTAPADSTGARRATSTCSKRA